MISPATGLVKNANTQVLIGHALDRDLAAALGRPVRVENDANCFALSEAADGAGRGARCVFGVILGTGCGGGIVVDGTVLRGRAPGRRRVGPHAAALAAGRTSIRCRRCWCGQHGCLELYLAGPGLARDRAGRRTRPALPARAAAGDAAAQAALERHADRLARGLAVIVNVLDPDVIVLGGGLSNMDHLYERVPALLRRYVFSDVGRHADRAQPARRQLRRARRRLAVAAGWPSLCRDCFRRDAGAIRARRCGSRRIVRHPELFRLAIAHVDCDAFYASVEKRDRPELAGRR